MDKIGLTFPPLRLKNGGQEQNMCSLNSNLQLLRHVPEFKNHLENFFGISEFVNTLHNILLKCGSYELHSALPLRRILSIITQRDLNSGAQHDTVELMGYILNHCPNELFHFETSLEHKFRIDGQDANCPSCPKLLLFRQL